MTPPTNHVLLCNKATQSSKLPKPCKIHNLEYLPGGPDPIIKIKLLNFVTSVIHLPDRILDLLEIAALIFGAGATGLGSGEMSAVVNS